MRPSSGSNRKTTLFCLLARTLVIITPFCRISGTIDIAGSIAMVDAASCCSCMALLTNSADNLARRLVSFLTQSAGPCWEGMAERVKKGAYGIDCKYLRWISYKYMIGPWTTARSDSINWLIFLGTSHDCCATEQRSANSNSDNPP